MLRFACALRDSECTDGWMDSSSKKRAMNAAGVAHVASSQRCRRQRDAPPDSEGKSNGARTQAPSKD
eukprot:3282437-Pleurochrysis_carterae.AAC.2